MYEYIELDPTFEGSYYLLDDIYGDLIESTHTVGTWQDKEVISVTDIDGSGGNDVVKYNVNWPLSTNETAYMYFMGASTFNDDSLTLCNNGIYPTHPNVTQVVDLSDGFWIYKINPEDLKSFFTDAVYTAECKDTVDASSPYRKFPVAMTFSDADVDLNSITTYESALSAMSSLIGGTYVPPQNEIGVISVFPVATTTATSSSFEFGATWYIPADQYVDGTVLRVWFKSQVATQQVDKVSAWDRDWETPK